MEVLAFNPRIRGVDFSELVSKQKTKRTNKKNPKKQKQPNKEQTILFFFSFQIYLYGNVCASVWVYVHHFHEVAARPEGLRSPRLGVT